MPKPDSQKDGRGHSSKSSQFKKGKSGHLAGRPKGRHLTAPHEAVLGRLVTIKDGGETRDVTAAEGFLLFLLQRGLKGESSGAILALLHEIEKARCRTEEVVPQRTIIVEAIGPEDRGMFIPLIRKLRMATKLDAYRATSYLVLEDWIVQKAVDRLGDRRLTLDEQTEVVSATRAPRKIRWPEWWQVVKSEASSA